MRVSTILALALLALSPACGDDDDDDDVTVADAASEVVDASAAVDASGVDAASASCGAQTVEGCPEPCVTEVGAYWDGDSCEPILCCCEGPDCDETYASMDACLAARATCPGPRGDGESCGQSAGGLGCVAGLVCCYPCGIPDCDYTCGAPCAPGPGCEETTGCALVP